MIECRLSVFDEEIRLLTDCRDAIDRLSCLSHLFHIEDFCFEIGPSQSDYCFVYRDRHGPYLAYDTANKTLVLHEEWPEIRKSTLLRSLALLLTEVVRNASGRALIHASSVERNGVGYVFSGSAGVGKTSLALRLCLDHGYRMVSNDLTVIGMCGPRPYVYAGTKSINLRRSSLATIRSSLCRDVFGEISGGSPGWNDKRRLSPSQIGVQVHTEPVPLGGWLMIGIESGWQGEPLFYSVPSAERRNPWIDKATMFEELSRFVRGSAYSNIRSDGTLHPELMMPMFDTEAGWRNRVELVEQVCEERKSFVLRASLSSAVDWVTALHGRDRFL